MESEQLKILENNKTHTVDKEELAILIKEAKEVYQNNFDNSVQFERSIFINWTCAIADCKYCYLSTRPKLEKNALRSPESIQAEALICKLMGWDVGYITGGLRVEPTEYIINLLNKLEHILGRKVMMNFGPYSEALILKFKPHTAGMGCAIESFDEELHNFICPSKPLSSLMYTLETLKKNDMTKLITIILGMGEKKEDVNKVIEKIKEYNIEKLQLCFLKPIENTVFAETPPPNVDYMAWWVAKVRIACPQTEIKVALVKECINGLSKLLDAGANGFSRFFVFNDFSTDLAKELESQCKKANRELKGNFTHLPDLDIESECKKLNLDEKTTLKAKQYYEKLKKLTN